MLGFTGAGSVIPNMRVLSFVVITKELDSKIKHM